MKAARAVAKPKFREVTLPDGSRVNISETPETWWFEANGSGMVDPAHIAPDPKNVRRSMSPARLAELKQSISTTGVRQSIVVTPRSAAPWAKVDPRYDGCFFLAVGGHRRRVCALESDIEAVPIKVQIYASEKEHRMDMMLLNKGQEPPTDLEQGYELVGLQELGWSVKELAEYSGLSTPHMYSRMHLTKLEPGIQAMLDEEARGKRLGVTLGGDLGAIAEPTLEELRLALHELSSAVKKEDIPYLARKSLDKLDGDERRFGLQHLLLAVIQRRGLSGNQSKQFILDHKLKLSSSHPNTQKKAEGHKPYRRKEVIESIFTAITGSLAYTWLPAELDRIFELSPREEVDDFIERCRKAETFLAGLRGNLERIRGSKKGTSAEVLALLEQGKLRRKVAAG